MQENSSKIYNPKKQRRKEMEKVNTVLIASGSGTDADAIMKAYKAGFIPGIDLKALISTKSGAGCLEKAKALGVPIKVIDRSKYSSITHFNMPVSNFLMEVKAELVFLVGCIVKIYPIPIEIGEVAMYNIHPADPHKYGGNGMYGLEVHRRVIRDIIDRIKRGKVKPEDRFFTYPTIHEVVMDYDSGEPFLQAKVEVPTEIIFDALKAVTDEKSIDVVAGKLQQVVLPNEWIMLPAAVEMAAMKKREKKEGR
jgi:phosphoribosylglycinamide formyltransferase-1